MKVDFVSFLSDKRIRQFTWISGIIFILFVLVTPWKLSSLPTQIPLFYSLPRSTDQLGTPIKILLLPLFSTIFSAMNLYLASVLYERERLASVILAAMSAACSFLFFVAFIKIVFLVT